MIIRLNESDIKNIKMYLGKSKPSTNDLFKIMLYRFVLLQDWSFEGLRERHQWIEKINTKINRAKGNLTDRQEQKLKEYNKAIETMEALMTIKVSSEQPFIFGCNLYIGAVKEIIYAESFFNNILKDQNFNGKGIYDTYKKELRGLDYYQDAENLNEFEVIYEQFRITQNYLYTVFACDDALGLIADRYEFDFLKKLQTKEKNKERIEKCLALYQVLYELEKDNKKKQEIIIKLKTKEASCFEPSAKAKELAIKNLEINPIGYISSYKLYEDLKGDVTIENS